jgi:hypothetical protein
MLGPHFCDRLRLTRGSSGDDGLASRCDRVPALIVEGRERDRNFVQIDEEAVNE